MDFGHKTAVIDCREHGVEWDNRRRADSHWQCTVFDPRTVTV